MHKRRDEEHDLWMDPLEQQEEAVQSFVAAADAFAVAGHYQQAEWRYSQALKQAELFFGPHDPCVKRVLVALMTFYMAVDRTDEAALVGKRLAEIPESQESSLKDGAASDKRLNRKPQTVARDDQNALAVRERHMPRDVRRACQVLGVAPEKLTAEKVYKAWKHEIKSSNAHPDLGGDAEVAVLLNDAKDKIVRWLETSAPKLGKKFEKLVCK